MDQAKVTNHGERMASEGVPAATVARIWCTCGQHLYSPSTRRWHDVGAKPTVVRVRGRKRLVHVAPPADLPCLQGRGPTATEAD
jgi:hypothetical protein